MKKKYYVSKIKQANGDHEVHIETCQFFPNPENRIFLGDFASCQDAVREANRYYNTVNGCYYCCITCHRS